MPLCMAATTAALRRTTPQSFLARLVADNRIVSERRAVGGGHGTLGRQHAGRRAACDAFGVDERGHRSLIFGVTHDLKSLLAVGP